MASRTYALMVAAFAVMSFALGFFQGALLKDPKKVLVQLGQVHAARVMKFTSAKDITDVVAIQSRYAQTQMQAYSSQAQELGRRMADITQRA